MDAKRLILPVLAATAVATGVLGAVGAPSANAAVPLPEVSPYLRAAIAADIKAKGHDYGGDCKFDVMYLAPGKWCSIVQSANANGATVTYGPYASDDIATATFVQSGVYGWKNQATGVGSPEKVPALAAQPGSKADSWVIEGINFPAGKEIALFDSSGCGGEQRCPGDHLLVKLTPSADGYFKTTVQFDPAAKPILGQTRRLLQVSDGSFIQVAFHQGGTEPQPAPTTPSTPSTPTNPTTPPAEPTQPTTPSAPTTPSTPQAPDVGDSDDDAGNDEALIWGAVASLGIVVIGTLGYVGLNRRR